jgi:uncharacterized DUF497 family protein
MEFRFDWNDDKNRINQMKHGVSFEEAAMVFTDSMRVEIYDRKHSITEERWKIFGLSSITVLTVSCTERDGIVRIISARKASKIEEEAYYHEYDKVHSN